MKISEMSGKPQNDDGFMCQLLEITHSESVQDLILLEVLLFKILMGDVCHLYLSNQEDDAFYLKHIKMPSACRYD